MERLSGMRIWVTGAEGFVGRHLVPRLRAAGAEVLPTDADLDVADPVGVAGAYQRLRPDAVLHLAAKSSVAESLADARGVFETNYLGARAILAGARRHAPRARVLLVGSGAIYGSSAPGDAPFREDALLRPATPYAWSKACADLLGATYTAEGRNVVRARPFNHTGPGQSEVFVASSLARQLAQMEAGRREPLLRVGNLESVRDFLDVEDVVEAYARLLDPRVPPGAYNVASGRGTSIRELLDTLLRHARVAPRIEVDPALHRPTEVSVGSAERLEKATGWTPRRALSETLERLLASWRDSL